MENYDWFIKLYSNIKIRLSDLIVSPEMRIEFEKDFDVSKLKKLIDKGLFSVALVDKIVNNIFKWITSFKYNDKFLGLIKDIQKHIELEDDLVFTFREINKLIDVLGKEN